MQNFFAKKNAKQFVTLNLELNHASHTKVVHGSKLLLVLPSLRGLHGTEKAKLLAIMVTHVCCGWGDVYKEQKNNLCLGALAACSIMLRLRMTSGTRFFCGTVRSNAETDQMSVGGWNLEGRRGKF